MDRMSLVYSGKWPNLLCCEAIIREAPNGDWITVFQCGGPTEPHPDNRIFLARSQDQGQTWSSAQKLFEIGGKAIFQNEVFVHHGEITIFLLTHNGRFLDLDTYTCTSRDNGYTWGELKPFPHRPRTTYARNMYICKNGDWIMPFLHYDMDEDEYDRLLRENKYIWDARTVRSENGVLISRDQGNTWECHGGIRLDLPNWNWAESNVVELSNGTLVMLIRADKTGFLYRSDSSDGGLTWSEPYQTDITNAGSKMRLLKLNDGRIALLHNPSPNQRNPLSLWISKDDMESWYCKRDVITFPGWLSYPDGFLDEANGYIHFTFDYSRHDVIYVGAKI